MKKRKNKTKFSKKRQTILVSVTLLSQKATMGKDMLKKNSHGSRHLLLVRT